MRVSTIELGVQDMEAALEAWVGELPRRAVQQGGTVQWEGHTTVGPLAFHASTLRRAVRNVIHNVLEAMP